MNCPLCDSNMTEPGGRVLSNDGGGRSSLVCDCCGFSLTNEEVKSAEKKEAAVIQYLNQLCLQVLQGEAARSKLCGKIPPGKLSKYAGDTDHVARFLLRRLVSVGG